MKKKFKQKASLALISTVQGAPKSINRMLNTIIKARAFNQGKTEVDVFADIVMREAERSLGYEEALRMLKVFEREEQAVEDAFNRRLEDDNLPK